MSKNAAMAPMMACKTLAMPLTIAMRQAPMVRKREVIYLLLEIGFVEVEIEILTQDTTAPILRFVARCDFACVGFCWFVGEDSR